MKDTSYKTNALVKIKNPNDSKFVYIPIIGFRNKSRLYSKAVNLESGEFYHLVTKSEDNTLGNWNELIPRKQWHPIIPCEPHEATLIKSNKRYYTECVHIGDGNYMRFEKVKLWDNPITGLNNIKWEESMGATIFKVNNTAEVEYFRQISKEQFWGMHFKIS